MKRLISLLMAISMLLVVLAGCNGGKDNNPGGGNDPANNPSQGGEQNPGNTPSDNTPSDGIDRSQRIKIGFAISNFDNENFAYMDKILQAYCDENNIEYVTRQHNSQSSAIMEIMENFMAANCDGVIFQNSEPESIQATLEEMVEKGIKVVSYDAEVEGICGSWICSNYATGQTIGECAADFINNTLGGVCDYVVMDSQVVFMQERVKGIMDTLAEKCPNSTMVATQKILLAQAVDTFESMLTAYPTIQVLCTGYSTCATNIIAAWLPELQRQGADLSQYGVFTCDCTNLDLEYMNETRKGGDNILRSTVDLGLKVFVPMGMITQCEAAIRGFDCEYADGTTQVFPYEAVTFENMDEVAAKYEVTLA